MKLQLGINGKNYEVEVEVIEDDETDVAEEKVCRSPVAGLVIKVNVNPGHQIKANDLLMVLEAMKMETNITAAAGGEVKAVRVGEGDAVKVNQVLVEFA